MEVIRGLQKIKSSHQGCVAALGFFDGVHLAHQALVQTARIKADSLKSRVIVYTFDRHPLEIVEPSRAPLLLTTGDEKISLMGRLPIDFLLIGDFTEAISRLEPGEFLRLIIADQLEAAAVVVGYNYRYGKGHQGDVYTLLAEAPSLGLPVEVVQPIIVKGEPVSSTRIRHLLAEGEVEEAALLLSRRYALSGIVVKGDGRGKSLGFPTANLSVPERKLVPKIGIYAGMARVDGLELGALVSIGKRPTFGGSRVVVEVYLLDYSGEIYGQELSVEFVARLRDEEKFDSAEALIAKMQNDLERGREILAEEGKIAARRKNSG